ncbi:MAG: hypothetical protein JWN87_717, partial [Frankiales bacterium]|nr:hypothetical protein [Frankiales bacterium]
WALNPSALPDWPVAAPPAVAPTGEGGGQRVREAYGVARDAALGRS